MKEYNLTKINNLIASIKKPTLIVDVYKVHQNIDRMVIKAKNSNVRLRPHFKTHQSKDIGEIFREKGITSITVSSIDMANYFANHGWDDITVAIPVNIRQIDEISNLAKRISLGILVDSIESLQYVKDNLNNNISLKIWIEIDTGYDRSGIKSSNVTSIRDIVSLILETEKFLFGGLLTHAGHTYNTQSADKIKEIYKDSVIKINFIKDYLKKNLDIIPELSIGDTPSCSLIENFSDVDEIRPGNFVFYDLTQTKLHSCKEEDISIVVACPVIKKNIEKREIIIYGGTVHLSKESLQINGNNSFGLVCLKVDNNGRSPSLKNTYVSKTYQEHGTIKIDKAYINQIKIGDIIFILPIHSCITANLYKNYKTLSNKTFTSLCSLEE